MPIRDDKWFDFSGKGNHGTIIGATWTAKGRLGPSLSFDGVDDYVEVPHSASLTSPVNGITVMAWIKCSVLGTFKRIAGKDFWSEGFIFRIEAENRLMTRLWFTDDTSTPELEALYIDDLLWHQVAFTFDTTTGKVIHYKDALTTYAWTGYAGKKIKWGTGKLSISGGTDGFDGFIDEVRIYNRALTAEEIEAHFLGARVPIVRQL